MKHPAHSRCWILVRFPLFFSSNSFGQCSCHIIAAKGDPLGVPWPPYHFLSLLLFLSSPGLFLIDLMQVLHNRSAWSLDGYGKTNSGDCFMWQMSEAVKPSWGTQEASQNTHKSSCMFPGICKATRMSKPVPRPRKNLGGPQSRQLTLECWRCAPNSKHTYHLRKSSLFICPLP